MTQLRPRVIPDTPVIRPYDRQVHPADYGPEVDFDVALMPPPEPRKRRGLPAPPIAWPPAERLAQARAAAERAAQEQREQEQRQQQEQQQPALVLDPALQDVSAVTTPLETTHTGAYENGMGIIYGSGSGANNNNGDASTTGNPASSSNPTCQEAENALKVVISFLESNGRDIVKDSDRESLYQIRGAMNQWSNRMFATA